MDPTSARRSVGDLLTVRRAFGEPVDRDGVTVIPVARVSGGGGGGHGEGPSPDGGPASGGGEGVGLHVRPLGVYVVRGQEVTWQPAMDLQRVIQGGQLVGAVALVALAYVLGRRGR